MDARTDLRKKKFDYCRLQKIWRSWYTLTRLNLPTEWKINIFTKLLYTVRPPNQTCKYSSTGANDNCKLLKTDKGIPQSKTLMNHAKFTKQFDQIFFTHAEDDHRKCKFTHEIYESDEHVKLNWRQKLYESSECLMWCIVIVICSFLLPIILRYTLFKHFH